MLPALERIRSFRVKIQFFCEQTDKMLKCKVDHKFSVGFFNKNSKLELKNKHNNSIKSRSVMRQVTILLVNFHLGAPHGMS